MGSTPAAVCVQLKDTANFQVGAVTLVAAASQVVAGANYQLTMDVEDKATGKNQTWEAVVFKSLGGSYNVTSLKPLAAGAASGAFGGLLGGAVAGILPVTERPGGYSPVGDENAADVQAAFDLVSSQITLESGATSVQLLTATQQIVAGKNFKLVLNAKGGTNGAGQAWTAVVNQPLTGEDTITSLAPLTLAAAPGASSVAASIGGSVGGYTDVTDLNDDGVKTALAAAEALVSGNPALLPLIDLDWCRRSQLLACTPPAPHPCSPLKSHNPVLISSRCRSSKRTASRTRPSRWSQPPRRWWQAPTTAWLSMAPPPPERTPCFRPSCLRRWAAARTR